MSRPLLPPHRRVRLAAFALAALLAVDVAARADDGQEASSAADRHVLIVSIDGFPYDEFAGMRAKLPTLDGLAKRGVHGPSRTVFPSMTWPSHTSLVTGSMPARHGVLGNRIFLRKRKRVVHTSTVSFGNIVRTPTLFQLTDGAGMTSSAIQWAGTQSAPGLTWNIPEGYSQGAYARGSTKGLLDTLRKEGLPTQHLGRFSKRAMFLQDSFARDVAIHLVETERPRLQLLHFLSVDSLSHSYGPRNRVVRWGMELVDGYIGDVLAAYGRAGLLDRTDVMIVSDHGFFKIERCLDGDKLLAKAGLISNLKRLNKGAVRTVTNGHALFVYALRSTRRDRVLRKVTGLFEARPEVERVIQSDAFEELGLPSPSDDPNMGDLIVLSKPDVAFCRIKKGDRLVRAAVVPGMHGYLPDAPGMQPLFIAAGPGFKATPEPVEMRNVDVAPTAARVLGLAFEGPIDGRAREDLLAQ